MSDFDPYIEGYFTDRVKAGDRLDPATGKIVNINSSAAPQSPAPSGGLVEAARALEGYRAAERQVAARPSFVGNYAGPGRELFEELDRQLRAIREAFMYHGIQHEFREDAISRAAQTIKELDPSPTAGQAGLIAELHDWAKYFRHNARKYQDAIRGNAA